MQTFDPGRPRLLPLELKWIQDGAEPYLFMRDPSGIAPRPVLVPPFVALLLSLCDGERDLAGIRAAFELRTGQPITIDRIRDVLQQLDEGLFLDTPRFRATQDALIREYRERAFRPPALAGRVYPPEPSSLLDALNSYGAKLSARVGAEDIALRGVVSPHIDYQRGGPIYAATWQRAAAAVQDADLIVIFGTDHCGSYGRVTLTRQNYATPLGVLPTALDVV